MKLEPLCTYRDYHWQLRGERGIPRRCLSATASTSWRTTARGPIASSAPTRASRRGRSGTGISSIATKPLAVSTTSRICFGRPSSKFDLQPGANANSDRSRRSRTTRMPAAEALDAERARQHRDSSARFAAYSPRISPCRRPPMSPSTSWRWPPISSWWSGAMPRGTPLGKTVIAGYPWFSDWGRDTMIALPGLTLATGRDGDRREHPAHLRALREPGHAAEPLSRRRRGTRIQHRRRQSVVFRRASRVSRGTRGDRGFAGGDLSDAARTCSTGTCAARASASTSIRPMACCAPGSPGCS